MNAKEIYDRDGGRYFKKINKWDQLKAGDFVKVTSIAEEEIYGQVVSSGLYTINLKDIMIKMCPGENFISSELLELNKFNIDNGWYTMYARNSEIYI